MINRPHPPNSLIEEHSEEKVDHLDMSIAEYIAHELGVDFHGLVGYEFVFTIFMN